MFVVQGPDLAAERLGRSGTLGDCTDPPACFHWRVRWDDGSQAVVRYGDGVYDIMPVYPVVVPGMAEPAQLRTI